MDADELAESLAPQGEFNLGVSDAISRADCETLITERGRAFGLDLSKQGINKRRKGWGEINAKIAGHHQDIEILQQSMKNAEQIDRVQIWAERLRKKVDKNL